MFTVLFDVINVFNKKSLYSTVFLIQGEKKGVSGRNDEVGSNKASVLVKRFNSFPVIFTLILGQPWRCL